MNFTASTFVQSSLKTRCQWNDYKATSNYRATIEKRIIARIMNISLANEAVLFLATIENE